MMILIIGGTGLISVSITQFLIERGEDLTLYNRGKSPSPLHPRAIVIHGDRTDHAAFEAQMAQAGRFDVVMDMVGYQPADGDSVVRAFAGRTGHLMTGSFKRGSATGRHSWRHLPNNAQANAPRIVTQNGGMFKYLIHIMPAHSVDIAFIVSSL